MDAKHPLEAWRSIQVPPKTQAEVAQAIGTGAPFISLLENGERFASIGTARKLARLTGIPFERFMPVIGLEAHAEAALNG